MAERAAECDDPSRDGEGQDDAEAMGRMRRGAGGAGVAWAQGALVPLPADAIIAARQARFDLQAGNAVGMKAAIDGGGDVKGFRDAAKGLSAWGRVIPSMFPDGTQAGHDTRPGRKSGPTAPASKRWPRTSGRRPTSLRCWRRPATSPASPRNTQPRPRLAARAIAATGCVLTRPAPACYPNRTSIHTIPALTASTPAASTGLAKRGWRRLAGRRFLPVTIARTRPCRFTAA